MMASKYVKILFFSLSMTVAEFSHASDWGCQVVLCLSDPRGATTEAECVPPISKLWSELAKGHGFPTCDLIGGGDASSGNSVAFQNAGDCPPQYLVPSDDSPDQSGCLYSSAMLLTLNNEPYIKVWMSQQGTVIQNLSAAADAAYGTANKFNADYAAWKAAWDAEQRAETAGEGI